VFRKILIANRGEIALRVIRTCAELGIPTVAVYSTEDRDSLAARAADQAICIGPGPARQSYLSVPAILEAATQAGADAIHPGYGFLSEDPDFAEACGKQGITFIGPPADLLGALGDKVRARTMLADAGLPLLPGSPNSVDSVDAARKIAAEIGYPLIVKAVSGGGGRGMRIARAPDELGAAYTAARSDAQALFTDSRVYIERYLSFARHVEVQVLCDTHGAGVHLGDRDCTIQRRQQKLIEESPAPGLPAAALQEMKDTAVRSAKAIGFTGAGTFEFLADAQGRYYFMEVNGRIQVEHPVTEMATGTDIVAEQIRIAAGASLGYGQAEVSPRGAVIECRVNAEDPSRGFAPTPGLLEDFRPPSGPFVRVDAQGYPGLRIPACYDSLLAKVIVWAPDRTGAIARMQRALSEFIVCGAGISTTIGFLQQVLASPAFLAAEHSTALAGDMIAGAR
jgi:acetyl-CoA carboxylase biotin carboxylase subunit